MITGEPSGINAANSGTVGPIPFGYCSESIAGTESSLAAAESNGVIALAFNTGNVIAVQSSEALSSAFVLADGSAYRFNHATQSWQGA